MKETDLREKCRALHAAYVRVTGLPMPYSNAWELNWCDFLRTLDLLGDPTFSPADLELVIRHRQRGVAEGTRQKASLRLPTILRNADEVQADLAECRARARQPRVDADRADVLRATGRPAAPEPPPARPAGPLAVNAAERFRQFKEGL